jgi:predicted dehydrogenase
MLVQKGMLGRRPFLGSLIAGTAASVFGAEARIRVAQIGTQHAHASGKMQALKELPETYEILGVSSSGNPDAKTYAGVPRMRETDLLAHPGLQVVVVETRIEESCETALRAVRAGKHIHLDKPGGTEHSAFKAMRREAEERGLSVQMGYMLRYNPAFELLFKARREGWLGEILEIDAMMGKLADPPTRTIIGSLSGGGMFELACHIIDASITLLGKPSEVHAFSTPSRPADGIKDNQLAVLVYPKTTVTIRCNHTDPFGGPRRRFQVAGTKGAMEIMPLESGKATLWLDEARGPWKKGENKIQLTAPKDRYAAEFIDLASVIRGERPLAWSAAHDIAVHETVLRAAGVGV